MYAMSLAKGTRRSATGKQSSNAPRLGFFSLGSLRQAVQPCLKAFLINNLTNVHAPPLPFSTATLETTASGGNTRNAP